MGKSAKNGYSEYGEVELGEDAIIGSASIKTGKN